MSNFGPSRINLSKRIWGFGLIIPFETGVSYVAITCGCAYAPRSVEGFFVPLNSKNPPQNELWNIFTLPWKPNEVAKKLDKLLTDTGVFGIRVDTDRIGEIQECWVPVLIDEDKSKDPIFEGENFSPSEGILTWQNSD